MNRAFIVGIDPGTQTGLAIFRNTKLSALHTMNTYEAIVYLQENQDAIDFIALEDSNKQGYIWESKDKTKRAFGRHARNIGSIDGKVRVFLEACEALNIDVMRIAPRTKGSKINHKQFIQLYPEYTKQANQHERDAAMCVYSALAGSSRR